MGTIAPSTMKMGEGWDGMGAMPNAQRVGWVERFLRYPSRISTPVMGIAKSGSTHPTITDYPAFFPAI
jgi:hypothetical protein